MSHWRVISTPLMPTFCIVVSGFCLLGIAACASSTFAQEKADETRPSDISIANEQESLAVASRFVDLKCDATFRDLDHVERLGRACVAWMEAKYGVDSMEAERARFAVEEVSLLRTLPPAEQSRYRRSLGTDNVRDQLKKTYATIPATEEARDLQNSIKTHIGLLVGDWQRSDWHCKTACRPFQFASALALLMGDTRSAERWMRIPAQESLSSKGVLASMTGTTFFLGNYIQVLEAIPNSAPLRSSLLDVYYQRLSKLRAATAGANDEILQFNAYSVQASYDAGEYEEADSVFATLCTVVDERPNRQSATFVNLRAWIPRYEAQRLHDRGDYAASREKIKAAIPLTIAAAEQYVGLPAPLLLRDRYILDASNCRMLGLEDEAKARQQQADEITAKFEALQREVKVDFDTILGEYAQQFRRR